MVLYCRVLFTIFSLCTLADDGYLKKFFEKTKDMSPQERGQYLQDDEVNKTRSANIAYQGSFDSSVGRAVDCRGHLKFVEIHRSLVRIRLEGLTFCFFFL